VTMPVPLPTILILSSDAVAAALLGALIETLGYNVGFARPPERGDDSIRRVRPKVCLVDGSEQAMYSPAFLGRAAMRGISVVIFGSAEALDRVRVLALEHAIDLVIVPPDTDMLAAALERAVQKAG
jgi:DNA-binding NtrC family response regulator